MIFIVLIIVNIQERDDAMATNSFLEEAEYHISIIRDPGSLPLQTQKTLNSSDMVTNDTVLTVDEEEEDKEDKESWCDHDDLCIVYSLIVFFVIHSLYKSKIVFS